MYVSNFHWQNLNKRGKSYGAVHKRRFNDNHLNVSTVNRKSLKRIDPRNVKYDKLETLNLENNPSWTSNLPGLNKNLFLNDEGEIYSQNNFREEKDRSTLPEFGQRNLNNSNYYNESIYQEDFPQGYNRSILSGDSKNVMSINGVMISPWVTTGNIKIVNNKRTLTNKPIQDKPVQ